MGRKIQDKHSNSYWDKHHHPEFNRNLLHIIKHHPLYHHLIRRNPADNVSQKDEVFSDYKNKNLSFVETRNSNVKEKLTSNSSVGKNTLRRQINALIKEISKRRNKIKGCLQCDTIATPRSDYLGCKHQPKKNGASTKFRKMNSDILTFLHDPVSPLIYNFHKNHVYKSKMTLTRSLSCPLPRGYAIIEPINYGSLSKGKGKSYRGNKLRVNGNINTNEAMVVRDASFSSGSSLVSTPIKNLKQKLDNVTGESRGKEKVRVAMDSVIQKIPQGCEGISDELKNEILKKLTDKVYSPLRRILSLQEPLERYWQYQDNNSFKTEKAYSPSRTRTDKVYSPLRMVIPFKRILSLPDLQSYSHDASHYGDISDISSLIKPIIASKDDNVISESMVYQKKRVDTPVEDFTQENLVTVDENDLVVNLIAASDSKSKPGHVEQEATMDSIIKVNETTKNAQKVINNFQVDITNKDEFKDEFNYVKYVLEISGLTTNECHSAWHSRDTPVDPLLYEEMEDDPDFCTYESGKCNHHVLFDLINETLLEIYGRSNSYTPMKFTIHEVWNHMSKILCLGSKAGQQTIDDHVTRDLLSKVDGWVNSQYYDDFVGLELEDLIFGDLLEEIIWDLACF